MLSQQWDVGVNPVTDKVHNLGSIRSLLQPVRDVAETLTPDQSEFLALLGETPTLVTWLRQCRDHAEFDNKLQVARGLGCITEPDLISAMESLKRVRLLLHLSLIHI